MHHNLQSDTSRVYMGHWYLWPVWAHKEAQTLSNMDGFLLLRKMSSFFPSSVRPNERKIQFEFLKQTQLHAIIQVFRVFIHTLWMLQPVAVCVVEVTTLKLFLTVVRHWHGDEWVHVVKALLIRETQVIKRFLCEISVLYDPTVRFSVKEQKRKRSVEP